MKITVNKLLLDEFIWKKEPVLIILEDGENEPIFSTITRLEFQYDALDNDYNVDWIEPAYNGKNGPYLILHCSK